MEGSTIICRCEELSVEEIEEKIMQGAETFSDIKRLTRCGMGPCQSKVCLNLVMNIIHQKTDIPYSKMILPRARPPLTPVKLHVLTTKNDLENVNKSITDIEN